MELASCVRSVEENGTRPGVWETGGGRRMKQFYWKCVDCQSMITDANMHDSANPHRKYTEFCYGCMSYGPEVVLAYD